MDCKLEQKMLVAESLLSLHIILVYEFKKYITALSFCFAITLKPFAV